MAIYLIAGLAPRESSESCDYYPEAITVAREGAGGSSSCSVLHRMGFILPRTLLAGRWALTPPFHPYPASRRKRGGIFSV